MTAIFWLIGITLSIYLAFYVPFRLFKRFNSSFMIGNAVAGFWLLWTLGFSSIFVGYALTGPLAIVQTILVITIFIYSRRKFKARIETLKKFKKLNDIISTQDSKIINLEQLSDNYEFIFSPSEHRDWLIKTLDESSESIVILSGWATDYSINQEFMLKAKNCLSKGVDIYLGWGFQKSNEKKVDSINEKNAKKALSELQEDSAENTMQGRLFFRTFKNHKKILICDNKYVIYGSFNWLSNNRGGSNEEESVVIKHPETVSKIKERYIEQYDSPVVPHSRRGFFRKFIPGAYPKD